MAKYITALNVSINERDEQFLQTQDFQKINVNLNKGAEGNHIYLWYKKGNCDCSITGIQTTFIKGMHIGLTKKGYTRIHKDLNAGTGRNFLYLWYFKGSTDYDTAIVDIDVTNDANAEASKLTNGWERVGCDLSRCVYGDRIHMWVKREMQTYICDVTATNGFGIDADNFGQGYFRMDEDVNMGLSANYVFIWYRQTTDPKKALTHLEISTTDAEYLRFQQKKFSLVNVNLNQGNGDQKVFLWYKRDDQHSIKATAVLVNPKTIDPFIEAGVHVIDGNLNAGNEGPSVFLCYYG